jgi:hypothetical protein
MLLALVANTLPSSVAEHVLSRLGMSLSGSVIHIQVVMFEGTFTG